MKISGNVITCIEKNGYRKYMSYQIVIIEE